MNLLWKRMIGMPRREILRAVVVVGVAVMGVVSWLDALREFAEGHKDAGVEALWGVLLWSLLAWGVMRNPAKWGFRVGLLASSCVLFAAFVFALIVQAERMQSEGGADISKGSDFWVWIKASTFFAVLSAFALSALSLRWLFKKESAGVKGDA